MARKSKAFSELLRLQKMSKTSPQAKQEPKSFKILSPKERESANPSNFEEQERRIGEVVGVDEDGEVFEVNNKTLVTYQNYLKQHLELPFTLTGSEDFSWEEYYIIGPGSKKEHDKLRKTRPSYLDTYKWLDFSQHIEEFYGLFVSVKRCSDGKEFVLPLADLKATDEKSKNYQLIDDYVTWFVNWR
jgi:hypothetical protein